MPSPWVAPRTNLDLATLCDSPKLQAMRSVHYTLHREESDYVAQCLDYDVSGFGSTEKEALANLKEATTPFSPPSGLATGSLNGLNPKSKFLAFMTSSSRFLTSSSHFL